MIAIKKPKLFEKLFYFFSSSSLGAGHGHKSNKSRNHSLLIGTKSNNSSMNATILRRNENRDEVSLEEYAITISSINASPMQDIGMGSALLEELPSISSAPSYLELRDRINREEIKQVVEDMNRDNMKSVMIDDLDITLRSYRVRATSPKRKVPNMAVEYLYATRKGSEASSSIFPSSEYRIQ